MADESIVATAIYYVSSTNITSELAIKPSKYALFAARLCKLAKWTKTGAVRSVMAGVVRAQSSACRLEFLVQICSSYDVFVGYEYVL